MNLRKNRAKSEDQAYAERLHVGMGLPKLQLLGGFQLADATGEEVRLASRKARALLAIVALAPGLSVTRARLKALLWGDRGEDQAGASLRQLLVSMRRELAPLATEILRISDESVTLDRQKLVIDVEQFSAAEMSGDAAASVACYGGALLEGFDLGGEAFEAWLASERRTLLSRAIAMFERHASELSGEARCVVAQCLVTLDPLREASHRALMAAYLANGEQALAKRQFEACKAVLVREFGVEPAAETVALLGAPSSATPATKPSVAVLPFANLSDDPAQRYFSDGITADIVTELSRFRQLLVRSHRPAGNHQDGDALTAGRHLAVQYVAEGSVRRLGKRIRITVQLLDVETGATLWSERFDADQEEVFSVQDKIVRSIAAQLSGHLTLAGTEKATRKPPGNLAAYELLLRGHAMTVGVPEAEAEARNLFQKAIDLDPGYARAYASLGSHLLIEWTRNLDVPVAALERALALTVKAVALDDGDDFCQAMLGRVHLFRRDHQLADYHFQKALVLNPNSPSLMAVYGFFCGFCGNPKRGLSYLDQAQVIDPYFDPTWYWRNRAVVHFIAHEYDKAIAGFKRSPIQPDWIEAYLAASYAYLGQLDEARKHAQSALRLTPRFTIQWALAIDPYLHPEDAEHLAEGLRRAGIPERIHP